MGRRVRDRLQRSGLVEFYRSPRPSGQVEQTQVTIVFCYTVVGKQERLGPFQVNTLRYVATDNDVYFELTLYNCVI